MNLIFDATYVNELIIIDREKLAARWSSKLEVLGSNPGLLPLRFFFFLGCSVQCLQVLSVARKHCPDGWQRTEKASGANEHRYNVP